MSTSSVSGGRFRDKDLLVGTICGCLCRPMGHDHAFCGGTAVPNLLVPLGRGSTVLVSACRACYNMVAGPRVSGPAETPSPRGTPSAPRGFTSDSAPRTTA